MTIPVVAKIDNPSSQRKRGLTCGYTGVTLGGRRNYSQHYQGRALRAAAARPLSLRSGATCHRGSPGRPSRARGQQKGAESGPRRPITAPAGVWTCANRQSRPQTVLRAPRLPSWTPSPTALAIAAQTRAGGAHTGSHGRAEITPSDRPRSPRRRGQRVETLAWIASRRRPSEGLLRSGARRPPRAGWPTAEDSGGALT